MPTPDTSSSPVYLIDSRPPAGGAPSAGDFIESLRRARSAATPDPNIIETVPLDGLACSSSETSDLTMMRQDVQVVLGMCPPRVGAMAIADCGPGRPIAAGLWYSADDAAPILEWCGGLAIAEDGGLLIVARDGTGLRITADAVEHLSPALVPGDELEAGLARAIDAWTTWVRGGGAA